MRTVVACGTRAPAAVASAFIVAAPQALAAAAPASAVSISQVGQIIVGLLVVLAVFAGCVLLLRRLPLIRTARNSHLKVIESVALGTRDRLLLVEVEDTRLLLGVTTGHISCLHVLGSSGKASSPQGGFSDRLQNILGADHADDASPKRSKITWMDV